MIKIRIVVWFCLVQLYCAGQNFFNNYYHTGYGNVWSSNVITTPDSGCVFFNQIEDSATGRIDFGLIKLDKSGNEQIKKSFNIRNRDYLLYPAGVTPYLIEATACSYFVAGNDMAGSIVINKINRQTLDTMNNVYYSGAANANYGVFAYIKFNENKYFLFGQKAIPNVASYPMMLQLDSNLNVVNEIAVNVPSIAVALTANAICNPDKKLILIEYGGSVLGNGNNQPTIFMHIDTLGEFSECLFADVPT